MERCKMKHKLVIAFIIFMVYLTGYFLMRHNYGEIWKKSNTLFVYIPDDKKYLYNIYRPIIYIDKILLNSNFEIAPQHN